MVYFCKSNKDQKTKRSNGPYCGDEMPPSFLSDSHKILVEANGGEIPNGMFYKGYAFTFKAVSKDTQLPRSETSFGSSDYSYGSAFYDYLQPKRRPQQSRPAARPQASPPARPPAARQPPARQSMRPSYDDYYDSYGGNSYYEPVMPFLPPRRSPAGRSQRLPTPDPFKPSRPSLIRERRPIPVGPYHPPEVQYNIPTTTARPIGSDPDVEYGEMPPQWDNPFAANDYDDYDYDGQYEYVVKVEKSSKSKKINPSPKAMVGIETQIRPPGVLQVSVHPSRSAVTALPPIELREKQQRITDPDELIAYNVRSNSGGFSN